jgi:Tfp pilus assembly protein PilE
MRLNKKGSLPTFAIAIIIAVILACLGYVSYTAIVKEVKISSEKSMMTSFASGVELAMSASGGFNNVDLSSSSNVALVVKYINKYLDADYQIESNSINYYLHKTSPFGTQMYIKFEPATYFSDGYELHIFCVDTGDKSTPDASQLVSGNRAIMVSYYYATKNYATGYWGFSTVGINSIYTKSGSWSTYEIT